MKDVFVIYHIQVMKYKPEFPYKDQKNQECIWNYVINEADIYYEVDVVGNLFNICEQKVHRMYCSWCHKSIT